MYLGGRKISHTFDLIDRIKTTSDVTGVARLIASCDWIGPGLRELRRQNGNGTTLTFMNDAGSADIGYDAVKRITRLRVLAPGGGAVIDRGYTYNRANMRTSEQRGEDFNLTDVYTYDSTYRVTSTTLDTLGTVGAVARDLQSLAYTYDGVGNRRNVTTVSASTGTKTEALTVNQVNEYKSKDGVARSHSKNGNLLDDGGSLYSFDYKNRLILVSDKAVPPNPVAAYFYYSDNRRARKVVFSGATQTETQFFYDGWRVCEEQSAAGVAEVTYVYSSVYIDEPVELERTAAHPLGAGEVYLHQNARADVVAVTDASGAVVERRFYDDFGNAFGADKAALVGAALVSSVGNPYGFQGRRLDPETGLYYFRARYYDTRTGRFVQRDPVWDAGNFGGQYSFAWNGPVSGRDAWGLAPNDRMSMNRQTFINRMKIYSSGRTGLTTEQLVAGFSENMKGSGNQLPGGGRYVFTEKGGWIDLLHFFEAASYAQTAGEGVANCLGFLNEVGQWLGERKEDLGRGLGLDSDDNDSGHPFGGNEDMRSNAAGADFGDEYVDNKKSLSSNVVGYLEREYGKIVDPPKVGANAEIGYEDLAATQGLRGNTGPQQSSHVGSDSQGRPLSGYSTTSGRPLPSTEQSDPNAGWAESLFGND